RRRSLQTPIPTRRGRRAKRRLSNSCMTGAQTVRLLNVQARRLALQSFSMNKSPDLHGNAPDQSPVALLLIDVINDFEFEGAEPLFKHALPASQRIADFKRRCTQAGVPTVYVNDNFGKWRSDFRNLISHCLDDNTRGRPIVELLKPDREDYFVLKPKHSGFYSTTLDLLLKHLGTKT